MLKNSMGKTSEDSKSFADHRSSGASANSIIAFVPDGMPIWFSEKAILFSHMDAAIDDGKCSCPQVILNTLLLNPKRVE